MAAVPVGLGPRPTRARRPAPHLRLLPSLPPDLAGDPQPAAPQPASLEPAAVRPSPPSRPPARPVPARRRPRPLRRLLPGLVTAGVLTGTWFGAGALAAARPAPAPAAGVRLPGASLVGGQRYVVQPGDTLWTIALRLDPAGDPRPLVDELAAEVPGGMLQPGDVLTLP